MIVKPPSPIVLLPAEDAFPVVDVKSMVEVFAAFFSTSCSTNATLAVLVSFSEDVANDCWASEIDIDAASLAKDAMID